MNYVRISSQEIGYLRLLIDIISDVENQGRVAAKDNGNNKKTVKNEPNFAGQSAITGSN